MDDAFVVAPEYRYVVNMSLSKNPVRRHWGRRSSYWMKTTKDKECSAKAIQEMNRDFENVAQVHTCVLVAKIHPDVHAILTGMLRKNGGADCAVED